MCSTPHAVLSRCVTTVHRLERSHNLIMERLLVIARYHGHEGKIIQSRRKRYCSYINIRLWSYTKKSVQYQFEAYPNQTMLNATTSASRENYVSRLCSCQDVRVLHECMHQWLCDQTIYTPVGFLQWFQLALLCSHCLLRYCNPISQLFVMWWHFATSSEEYIQVEEEYLSV